jgi:chromosome partitioning protein
MARCIAVGNEKGGTSKTTVTATLAAGLAQRGCKVIVIDTDPQGHLAKMFGMPKEDGLYHLLADYADWTDVLRFVEPDRYAMPQYQANSQMWLLPGHKLTAEIPLIPHVVENFLIFYERLSELDQYGIDYVLVDTTPTATLVDSMIYVAIDDLLLVTIPEELSYDGIKESREKLERFSETRRHFGRPDTRILGIQPNMARPNTNAHRQKLSELATLYPGEIWTPLKLRVGWTQATNDGKLVFAHAPKSGVTADAWDLVDRFQEALAR